MPLLEDKGTKVFLWYLKKVVLTKDNLAKRNWKGSTSCGLCSSEETIQHLFFDCHVAKLLWNNISISFGFQPPTCASSMFGSWLSSFPRKHRSHVLIGAAASCWAIWLNTNDMVFKGSSPNNSLQILFKATFWIRRSIMSKEEETEVLKKGGHQLEVTAMEVGWNHRNRIKA